MVPEMEKPRVTEIKVRMDCNGCVQKIKKALHGITGIYDIYIDFPEQKITIIGWADPEKIVKAIKKTRKTAVICLHAEQSDQPATEPPPEGEGPPPQPESPPHTEAAPPPEPQKEPQQTENPPPPPPEESQLPPESANDTTAPQPSKPKNAEEIHVIYHHPPEYGYRYAYGNSPQQGYDGQFNRYPPSGSGFRGEPSQPPPEYRYQYAYGNNPQQGYNRQFNPGSGFRGEPSQPPPPPPAAAEYGYRFTSGNNPQQGYNGQFNPGSGFRGEPSQSPPPPQPIYVTHSYNTYKPSPYVTEYAYPRSPPRYSYYSRPDHFYSQEYYYRGNNGSNNNNITSIFSEENPNACRIV